MAESHLSHSDFFSQLNALFSSRPVEESNSIYLTQKRLSYTATPSSTTAEQADPLSDLNPTQPLPVLIRATDGTSKRARKKGESKTKLSTVVQPDELEAFFTKYAEVCKEGMARGLKKRDRRGRKTKKKGKA